MFHREGTSRSPQQNRQLAGFLAVTGGFVNSVGFIVVGSFTSHVTGNVGRFSVDAAAGRAAGAEGALLLVGCFFLGALMGSVILEMLAVRSVPRAYAAALSVQAVLLVLVIVGAPAAHGPEVSSSSALLSAAMGLQNSLVTRISGAVVRTTHLTGVVTDMGIESGRWLRYAWLRASSNDAERPTGDRLALLGTISVGFAGGAVAGAVVGLRFGRLALFGPVLLLTLAAIRTFRRSCIRSEPP